VFGNFASIKDDADTVIGPIREFTATLAPSLHINAGKIGAGVAALCFLFVAIRHVKLKNEGTS